MTKKNWLLLVVLFALAVAYAIFFTDWFKPQTVHISHVVREMHFRRKTADPMPALIFGLNKTLKLTEVKVVPLAEFEKNPSVLPVWHLVSSSNSVPVRDFPYGQNIRGMKPAVPGSEAALLETNIVYRLFVTAGKIKGHNDFQLGGTPTQDTATANP